MPPSTGKRSPSQGGLQLFNLQIDSGDSEGAAQVTNDEVPKGLEAVLGTAIEITTLTVGDRNEFGVDSQHVTAKAINDGAESPLRNNHRLF